MEQTKKIIQPLSICAKAPEKTTRERIDIILKQNKYPTQSEYDKEIEDIRKGRTYDEFKLKDRKQINKIIEKYGELLKKNNLGVAINIQKVMLYSTKQDYNAISNLNRYFGFIANALFKKNEPMKKWDYYIKLSSNFLVTSAGLGSIVNHIIEVKEKELQAYRDKVGTELHPAELANWKTNITANELDTTLFKDYPTEMIDLKFTNNDFMKQDYSKNNLDCIIQNLENNKFYLDFLFKSVKILSQSSFQGEKYVLIKCPKLTKKIEKDGDTIHIDSIWKAMPSTTFTNIYTENMGKTGINPQKLHKYIKNDMKPENKKFENAYNEMEEVLGIDQMCKLMDCEEFGGTKASVYAAIVF